ncbi:DUF6703 family protein [Flexivirga meconopsidis]|uniref:DUF6703 family protein n=1 Tax=Flexivirga meconopsidis TaxID=2977121 RepID=UPI0022407306|nr:DUF6703 family protein [Flexivirga meconopsidis]
MSAPSRPQVHASPLRVRVEHASDPAVQAIGRAPRALPAGVALLLVVVGAILRGPVGAVCFGVLAAVVCWLLYLAWPRIEPIERMMRIAVLLLLVALTVVCAAG